jgi:ABC-2 type transport system ATP-binding protein
VLGQDPASADEAWRARTGVVLQSWRDHPRWTARRLLTHLGGFYEPFSTPERSRPYPADRLLETVRLTDLADRKLNTLSGGERRRLDVAVGIVGRPDLLFLDEPTAGFDPQARREFHQLLLRLTTHDLEEAARLADRVLILAGGRIVADDTPDGLARRVAGEAEVRWSLDGERFVRSVADATGFVRGLFAAHGELLADLEVRRASLEDAYLALVQQHEAGRAVEAAGLFSEVTR